MDVLPTELLALIMAEVVMPGTPNSLGHLPMHQYTYHHSPFPLSQVSRNWRSTARSTPTLWAQIDINLGGMRHADPWLAFLRTHLEHAGVLPLRLFLTWVSAECHYVVDTLAKAGVWRDLALRARAIRFDVWYALQLPASLRLALFSEPLPVLEELRFAWQPLQRVSSLMLVPLAPRLQSLHWTEFGRPLEWLGDDDTVYPEMREAHLRTDIDDAEQITEVFDRMPGLQTLSMHTFGLRSRTTPVPLLEHATLQHLQWTAIISIELSVAQAIRLPALRTATLDLPLIDTGFGLALPLARALFGTAFPHVRVLELNIPLSVPFAEILRGLAELRALTLYGDAAYTSSGHHAGLREAEFGAKAFFERMARSPWVCSRLGQLDIKNYASAHGSPCEEALLALARARSAKGLPAEEVEGRSLSRMKMIEPIAGMVSGSSDVLHQLNMLLAQLLGDDNL